MISAWARRGPAGHSLGPALALFLTLTGPAVAGERRVLLVLRPELTARQLYGFGSPMASLLPRAAIGVMNAAVPGPKVPASATLTLGAGHRVAAGPLQERIRFPAEPVEGDTALTIYSRRLGWPGDRAATSRLDGQHFFIHPAWAAFQNDARREGAARAAQTAGGLGAALSHRGGAGWIGVGGAGSTRWGALAVVDQSGIVPSAEATQDADPELIRQRLRRSRLVVLDLPGEYPLDRLATLLLELSRDPTLDLLLVSPYPRPGPTGGWDSLPPLLAIGPGYPPGVLTSATTRTRGLVANIDLAPTVMDRLSIARPDSMTGRPVRSEPPVSAISVIDLAEDASLAHRAVVPLGIGIGIAGGGALLLSLCALAPRTRVRKRTAPGVSVPAPEHGQTAGLVARLARVAVMAVAASPMVMLLAPDTGAVTITGLGAAAAAVTLGVVTLLLAVPISRRRPLPWLFLITALVVASDVLLGGYLISRSPLSGYAVAGIRFYGLGNEYTGVLVGTSMLGALAFEAHLRPFRWLHAGFFLALLLLIGSPVHGADLGGALAAAAGFGAALAAASRSRRPVRTAVVVAAGLVIAGALFMTWDALRAPSVRTHIGEFARTMARGGWAGAVETVKGKIEMAVRLGTSQYALAPLIGLAPLLGLWYHGAGRWLRSLLTGRPEVRAASIGAVVAAWTALLLNDSGISTWMFINAALLAFLIDEQLQERA